MFFFFLPNNKIQGLIENFIFIKYSSQFIHGLKVEWKITIKRKLFKKKKKTIKPKFGGKFEDTPTKNYSNKLDFSAMED